MDDLLTNTPLPVVEAEQEQQTTLVIHNGIAMSSEDAEDQRRRDRNRRYVERLRRTALQNIMWSVIGTGKTRAQVEEEINAKYSNMLREMNRRKR